MQAAIRGNQSSPGNDVQLRLPLAGRPAASGGAKIGPQRTSKNASKLKLLPEEGIDKRTKDEEVEDVYSQISQISGDTARRDAERLGKSHRDKLPRVTAYCVASSFRTEAVLKFFRSRKGVNSTSAKQFDECIYSPFSYHDASTKPSVPSSGPSDTEGQTTGDLLGLGPDAEESRGGDGLGTSTGAPGTDGAVNSEQQQQEHEEDQKKSGLADIPLVMSEVFLFDYGVIVLWGFSKAEERRFLKDISRFMVEKLAPEDVEVEEFNYYVTSLYQPRIWNDFITLKDGRNYMIKLSISHAISQSVKISLFEELVDNTIEATKDIPEMIAETGKVHMTRKEIMMSVGELFILRININLQGSVLDSPELMWSEPQLEPMYRAARSYLEIDQRVTLLNQRVEVISDLLSMLKEQMQHSHGEYLEWIVIVLIGAEILVACANIIVDIYAEVL